MMPRAVLGSDVVRSFIDVVIECLRATVGVDATIAAVCEPRASRPTIMVALDLDGDVHGPVTWVFPPAIALELVRRLTVDPDPDPDTAADGATELANILTGHASSALESHGFQCDLGAPRVHVGALPAGITVHMVSASGPIDLVLSLSRG